MDKLSKLKNNMEVDFLKTKTYEEINYMFNQLNEKLKIAENKVKNLSSKYMLTEFFLLTNGFIKSKGEFGEYFFHYKYQLFRCWFNNGELQVGKKDAEKDICIWIATLDDKNDFVELFRILTKDTICNFNNSKNNLKNNY